MSAIDDNLDTVIEKKLTEAMHFVPQDGGHMLSSQCWCHPVLNYRDPVTGNCVWVHKTNEEARN